MSNDKMGREEQSAAFDAIISRVRAGEVFELTQDEETLMVIEGHRRDAADRRRVARMESR